MNKFVLNHKIDLSSIDDKWENCYLVINDLNADSVLSAFSKIENNKDGSQAQVNAIIELITPLFIEGKGWNGSEIVDINREDIPYLPLTILAYVFRFLAGYSRGNTSAKDTNV